MICLEDLILENMLFFLFIFKSPILVKGSINENRPVLTGNLSPIYKGRHFTPCLPKT